MQGKIGSKDPVKQYGSVRGLKVHYGSATDYSTYPEGPFDVVYDNNGKDMDSCKMLIDAAKVSSCASLARRWHIMGRQHRPARVAACIWAKAVVALLSLSCSVYHTRPVYCSGSGSGASA